MKRVKAKGVPVVAYESTLDAPEFFGSEVTHDLAKFKAECDVIVVNRWSDDLSDVVDKVYTRDLFKGASAEGGLCLGLCWIESRGVSACADAPLSRFWRGWILDLNQATRRAVQAIRFFFALSDRRYFANGFKSWYGRIDCVRQAARIEAVATPAFS